MISANGIERTTIAAALALAAAGILLHLELALLGRFHGWTAAMGIVAGAAIASRLRDVDRPPAGAPRWVAPVTWAILLAVATALAVGMVATPARHWDGFVAWEPRADRLALDPTLEQPFFADGRVFSHSRSYPLLQPLMIAVIERTFGNGMGRTAPLLLWALMAACTFVATRRVTSTAGACGLTIAVAAMPALINPKMGSFDSGFADASLAAAVTAMVAGLVTGRRSLLAAATALAVLTKPEGLVYGALLIAACWLRRERGMVTTVATSWSISSILVQLTQREIDNVALLVPPGLAGVAILIERTRHRGRAPSTGLSVRAVLVALLCIAIAVPTVLVLVSSDHGGAFSAYVKDLARPIERLAWLPELALGYVEFGIGRLQFGSTFILLPASMLCAWRVLGRVPRPTTAAFVLTGIASTAAAFFLAEEDDLRHHMNSSLARLLIHWTGASWILIGVYVSAIRPAMTVTNERDTTPR